MQKKTSQELFCGERHLPLLVTVRIIPPAERNLVTLEGHKTVVGDGDAMGVAELEMKWFEVRALAGRWWSEHFLGC